MKHYCTLFDLNYAAKGLALYESIARHSSEDFILWTVPMNDKTWDFLQHTKNLRPNMAVFRDSEVFNDRFCKAAYDREISYRCFMAAPWLLHHLLDMPSIDEATYLDADLGFYADPKIAHDEMGDNSVGIVPHRFMPHDVARLSPNGWFNVSWVTVKRDKWGMPILSRWREQTLEKCDRESCGDQKYLNEWPTFWNEDGDGVHIFSHEGIGVAPWNAMKYRFFPGPKIALQDGPGFGSWQKKEIVFYHYHELKRRAKNDYQLTGYPLPEACKELIYKPYIAQLEVGEDLITEYERTSPWSKSTPSAPTT
jgi:hypothetical protein